MERDDARLCDREPALTATLKLAFEVFATQEFSRPETLFEALARQSEVVDPETMPGVRGIVDQIQKAMGNIRSGGRSKAAAPAK